MPSVEMSQDQFEKFQAAERRRLEAERRGFARRQARRECLEENKDQITARIEEILNS